MLYISNIPNFDLYSVTDTDDRSVEVVSKAKLLNAVLHYGIKVHGVTVTEGKFGKYVSSIDIFEGWKSELPDGPEKTKLLFNGIDLRVFEGEITYISFSNKIMADRTRLRLSQYGNFVSFGVVIEDDSENTFFEEEHKALVLVFDDNITVTGAASLIMKKHPNVVFDISEVSNDAVAELFYMSVFAVDAPIASCNRLKLWQYNVIDKPERLLRYQQMSLLYRDEDVPEDLEKKFEALSKLPMPDTPWTVAATSMMHDVRRRLAEDGTMLEDFSVEEYKVLRKTVCDCLALNDGQFSVADFDALQHHIAVMMYMFRVLFAGGFVFGESYLNAARRFYYAVRFFIVPDDIKELLISVFNSVCRCVVEHCKVFNLCDDCIKSGEECFKCST